MNSFLARGDLASDDIITLANSLDLKIFLAHLSRRLMGELIVYQSLRRPSVRPSSVCPSTFSNIFSSETTGPIQLKFHMETP